MRTTTVSILIAAALLAGGCTSQQIYAGLQARQRNECLQLDEQGRDRCLAAADVSWADYERQRVQ